MRTDNVRAIDVDERHVDCILHIQEVHSQSTATSDMTGQPSIASVLSSKLGLKLYNVCLQNNLIEVRKLTTGAQPKHWAAAILAAASKGSLDVVSYCMEKDKNKAGITDIMLWK